MRRSLGSSIALYAILIVVCTVCYYVYMARKQPIIDLSDVMAPAPYHVPNIFEELIRNGNDFDPVLGSDLMKPYFFPRGSIQLKDDGFWWVLNSSQQVVDEVSYGIRFPKRPQNITSHVAIKIIEDNVVVVPVFDHYFHFFYETLLMIQALQLYLFNNVPRTLNYTVLSTGGLSKPYQRGFLDIFGINIAQSHTALQAEPNVRYQVGASYSLIMPRCNLYNHSPIQIKFNRYLMETLRSKLPIPTNPTECIFISRSDGRRRISQESEMLSVLRKHKNFSYVHPGSLTIKQQFALFSNASIIVAAHGAEMVNMVFANWDKVTLVEITGSKHRGSYKPDLGVKKHYVLISDQKGVDNQANLHVNMHRFAALIETIMYWPERLNGSKTFKV